MKGAHIKVFVQLGRSPSEHDIMVALPLSKELVRESYAKLDHPSGTAGIAEVFCTPVMRRVRVMAERKVAAKLITEALTEAILDSMSREDTVMGYPTK